MIFSEKTKTQPISKEQVWAAWLRVRSHYTKGSGADDVSLEMIEQNPRKYLYPVWNRLASGSYMAPPVKEMRIPKSPRSWRTLGIPTICDRVAQDVIREELTKIVEPLFSENSYAFRPKVLGWIQYYKKVVPSSLRVLFHYVNFQLIKWLMHKHHEGYRKAKRRYWFLTHSYPTLFIHWQYGLTG